MLYFVRENRLHRFPIPKRCGTHRDKELLRDTIPHSMDQCIYCMNRWPEDDE